VGKETRTWSFDEAAQFIIEQFATYSQKLSDFARRAFEERWIDAPPQPGKHDGAYCMRLRRDESRILTNYKPVFNGMGTLAHELGHAYHNLCLAERTYLQRMTPATLAETASIFCNTIIDQAALRDADREEQIAILEASLQGVCQVVVDITSRYLFATHDARHTCRDRQHLLQHDYRPSRAARRRPRRANRHSGSLAARRVPSRGGHHQPLPVREGGLRAARGA
jgi:oligoendopeptidase F